MFEKCIVVPNKCVEVPLPEGKEKLFITEEGQIFSIENGPLATRQDAKGFLTVSANLWDGPGEYQVSLISLVAYGKLKLSVQYLRWVEPFHLNGDKENLHPSNLGYRYTQPIEHPDYFGFYYVPFFNDYIINEKGVVINAMTGNKLTPHEIRRKQDCPKRIKGGYWFYNLFTDTGHYTTVGRHRLLCLAFKPYPNTVDRLDVNHKDCVPGNDWLDNLEWATRSQNVVHAYENGLRSQNFVLYAKNVFTGEERQFYSAQEAKRQINGDVHAILRRVNDGSQKLYTGGWLFKLDPNEPWREVSDPHTELKALSNPTKAFSKNVFTGEIREHESIARIALDLGLEKLQAPKTYLLKGFTRPYCGYVFKVATDTTPWPEFSERELAVFRDNPKSNGRGVIARNAEGEELFFTNSEKAALHFQHTLKKHTDVMKAIARGRVVDGYRFYYL